MRNIRFIVASIVVLALLFCLVPAHAGELAPEDAAFVDLFNETYPVVEDPPFMDDYASAARYDELYMGAALTEYMASTLTNESGKLAWGLVARMRSLNEMYRATKDPKYLEACLDCARGIYSVRDDKHDLKLWTGEVAPAWGSSKYAERGRAIFAVHTGLIVYSIFDCLKLANEDGALKERLGEEYQALIDSGLESLAWHDRQWRDGPEEGAGHYIGLNQENVCEGKPLPGNRLSAMGLALWRAWELTGDPKHRDRAKALGLYIKNRLTVTPDGTTCYWPYWLPEAPVTEPAERTSVKGEDVSHASLTAFLPVLLAEAGEVFTEEDMRRFANTFLNGVTRLGDDIVFPGVTGVPADRARYADACGRWLYFAPYDRRVYDRTALYFRRRTQKPAALHLALLLRYQPE